MSELYSLRALETTSRCYRDDISTGNYVGPIFSLLTLICILNNRIGFLQNHVIQTSLHYSLASQN